MTKQSEILEDSNYRPILDHGFVGLIDVMGNDASIARAARVSYGAGTKTVNEDRGLIRHLIRHKHTSPIEMVEFKLHIKIPVFVMRQHVRHRTASLNEYSGRYSVMSEEFYIPESANIAPQSINNKQGREDDGFDIDTKQFIKDIISTHSEDSYKAYEILLGQIPNDENYPSYKTITDKGGLARELARMVLPVNYYTELYWKIDLHNLMHFLKLRMDSHAQYEIRVLANAIYELVKPHVPIAMEAYEDYILDGCSFSKQELQILRKFIYVMNINRSDAREMANEFIENKRELEEFITKIYRN